MSQDLYFYRQRIISEELAQHLSKEEVENSIKTLLTKRDLEADTKLREHLFEEVELCLEISAYNKGIKDLLDKKNKTEFVGKESRRLMMNKTIWSVVQKNVLNKYNEIENSEKSDKATKAKPDEQLNKLLNSKSFQLLKDYSILKDLFEKNLLFVNIH